MHNECFEVAHPRELTPTHGITKSRNQMKKLILDIKENGMIESIKYVSDGGKKYVVDGHHRLKAALKLGLKEVPIEEVHLPYLGYKTITDLFDMWDDIF